MKKLIAFLMLAGVCYGADTIVKYSEDDSVLIGKIDIGDASEFRTAIGALGTNQLTQTVTDSATDIPSGSAVTDALELINAGKASTQSVAQVAADLVSETNRAYSAETNLQAQIVSVSGTVSLVSGSVESLTGNITNSYVVVNGERYAYEELQAGRPRYHLVDEFGQDAGGYMLQFVPPVWTLEIPGEYPFTNSISSPHPPTTNWINSTGGVANVTVEFVPGWVQNNVLKSDQITQTVTTNATEIPSGAAVTDALAAKADKLTNITYTVAAPAGGPVRTLDPNNIKVKLTRLAGLNDTATVPSGSSYNYVFQHSADGAFTTYEIPHNVHTVLPDILLPSADTNYGALVTFTFYCFTNEALPAISVQALSTNVQAGSFKPSIPVPVAYRNKDACLVRIRSNTPTTNDLLFTTNKVAILSVNAVASNVVADVLSTFLIDVGDGIFE